MILNGKEEITDYFLNKKQTVVDLDNKKEITADALFILESNLVAIYCN